MDSSGGIGQSGRQNACEIPVNSGNEIRFDPANVDPRPGGCLDLLKALSDPSRSEYFFSDLKASQICWNNQIPGYGFRDPLGHLNSTLPSQRFMLPPPDLNRNFEPPGPRGDFGDINWNFGLPCSPEMRKDTTGNQNMIQFSPPTPDKNKTDVAGEHSGVASKDLGDAQQELPNPLVEESPGVNQKSSGTPNQKPKRRKIRPKVVIEGKKQRQRKAAMPKPVTTPEIPRVKRKYTRKHKDVPGTSNGTQVEHATGNNNVQEASERVICIDVEEAPVQQASKRKAAAMLPVSTPEIPRVERKYKWKQKKDPPGISDGNEVAHDNARQSARRALNFHVEEATKEEESSSKNADIVTSFEVDALHELGGALKNAGGDVGSSPQVGFGIDLSVKGVEESKLQENGNHECEKSEAQNNVSSTSRISSCNAQNASQDNLENAAGLVSSSWQADVGVGSFVNLSQECKKPRLNVNLIDEVSEPRKNVLSGTRNSCCNAQDVLESADGVVGPSINQLEENVNRVNEVSEPQKNVFPSSHNPTCNAQNASQDVLDDTGGGVGSSPQPDFGAGLSVNLLQENVNRVHEVSGPQKNVPSTTQTSRPHGLRENMKTLARKRNGSGRQIISGISEAQGISTSTLEILKKKRSKREQDDTVCDNENRSFNLYDGSSQVMYNGFHHHPLPVIPEQWKRKRAEIKQSQYHLNVSSSLLPSSSNEVPSCENGQKTLSCMTAETVPRNDRPDTNVNYVPSMQVSDFRLITQANAMCYSQLPSSLSYHSDPPSDRTRAVTEAKHSGVPRKRTATKKGKAPEVGALPSGYPLHKKRKAGISSSFSLYSTFSQYSILEHMDYLVQKLICLNINGIAEVSAPSIQNENALIVYNGNGTMVPYGSLSNLPKRRKPRPRVNLDSETNRVWLLLMGTASADAPEGTDAQKEKWWEEERRVFRGRAESFIARMHLVQGDRRFSPWKGSVVDSVVGVFLTQNVSDHLSSSAFMNLAARFPIQRTMDCNEVEIPTENGDIYLAEFDSNMKEQERLTKESVDSEDSGCTKSLDNAAIDLNSVASSQNSSDSPVKEYSNTGGACLQSQINSLHVPGGKMFPDFNTSSFMELLEAASNMFNFLPGETAAGATYQQEFPCDQEKGTSDPIYKDKDASTSIGKCESHSPKECNDPTGVPFVSSAIPNIYQSNYRHVGLENTDVAKEKPSTSAANTAGAIDSCNISNPCNCDSTKDTAEATGREASGLTSQCSPSSDPHAKINNHFDGSRGEVRSQQHSRNRNSPPPETRISFLNNCTLPLDECGAKVHQSSARKEFQVGILKNSTKASAQAQGDGACELQHAVFHPSISLDGVEFSCTRKAEENTFMVTPESHPKAEPINGAHEMPQAVFHHPIASDGMESSCTRKEEVKAFTIAPGSDTKAGNVKKEAPVVEKRKRKRVEKNPIEPVDWDSLRKQGCNDVEKQRSRESMDSVDWEAIRRADVSELSDCIRERGMNNRLAERIKEFLDRLVKDHGSIDLEWLRSVPPDKVKDYLLSIKGLGLKSVECVRLLTLHNLAFPVDTNVGRICVRLGWVPLQPLPESLQLHLLELYPILETIQKYLWPRLCKLDQRTLYELHYQMITFGKVFCTKSRPNCNACPMRGECKHFASAFASARLALPGPEEKGVVASTVPAFSVPEPRTNVELLSLPQLEKKQEPQQNVRLIAQSPSEDLKVMALSQQEITNNPEEHAQNNSQPIIEEPTTPEPECLEAPEPEIEDLFYEDSDEIPTIKLNIEKFTENLQNIMQASNTELQEADISKALVALTPDAASLPQPKLKNISRLRTEHRVYELPDTHPLVEGLEPREPDDPSPYLLAIWSPGETAESLDLPQPSCSSQATGILCAEETCSVCSCIREERAQIVRGTLLIPCRTAMRGSFPLNGTYFQVNEVFADHSSSLNPIDIPRQWIWNLPRRTVYFGTSVTTIFKGLTTEAIQQCFWRGFVCVRGFERQTRAPRPLMARLHFPASKVQKNKRDNAKEKQGQ